MAMMVDERHKREATDWLIRQRGEAFADWTGFTAWLEADPANAAAYDELSQIEIELAERLSDSRALDEMQDLSPPPADGRWSARWIGGGAVAACAAALAGFLLSPADWFSRPSYYAVATPPGGQQHIVLASGTRVSLNGGTRIILDRSSPHFARLIEGEASFDIAESDSGQFQLEVGTARLVDIGTSFNVLKNARGTEVEVAGGAVEYRSAGIVVRVDAGEQLRASPDALLMAKVDPSDVASWRRGRLVFEGEPLSSVAEELSRNIGKRVTVDPRISTRPVTAVIQMPPRTGEVPAQLERLLGVKVRLSDEEWVLLPAD